MKCIHLIGIALITTTLTGCVSNPTANSQAVGDSAFQPKRISFPVVGKQTKVQAGGFVHLFSDYESRFVYRLDRPFAMPVMLGKINATVEMEFSEAQLEGSTHYCSQAKAYVDPLVGPQAPVCFKINAQGEGEAVRVTPGFIPIRKQTNQPVSFSKKEVPWVSMNKVLKRELIFDGSEKGIASFSIILYEQDLDKSTRIRNAIERVGELPKLVSIDGVVIKVIELTEQSLVYELITPWK